MSTIRFTLRTDKADKAGLSPIEVVYQIKGQRKYFRTKERAFLQSWDTKSQQVVFLNKRSAKMLLPAISYNALPSFKEVAEINGRLAQLVNNIGDIEKRFELDKIQYSANDVVDRLKEAIRPLTKREDRSNLVFDYIDKYIEDNKAVREPGSLTVYKSLKNHLARFQKEKKVAVAFDKIDAAFFRQFHAFLVTEHKIQKGGKLVTTQLNNTTAAKQLSTLKTFLNYARLDGISVSDKYKDFKITKPKLEVIALTGAEFEILYNLDLSGNRRLAQARDIFCFSCATGLRYSDLAQLRREHIKADEIKITVKKTRVELTIPLNPYSRSILARYQGNHSPLPVTGKQKIASNQNLNLYVKELCKLAGINDPVEIVRSSGHKRTATVYPKYELISVHTGRKTFVTVSLEKGMTAEEVMKISGHENYESFKRYVNVTEQRKKASMEKAWGVPLIKEENLSLRAV